jgi:flagellar protein FlaF
VLRGDLISIGIWMLREADAVEDGGSDVFRNLIEISAMIRDGLK